MDNIKGRGDELDREYREFVNCRTLGAFLKRNACTDFKVIRLNRTVHPAIVAAVSVVQALRKVADGARRKKQTA